MYIIANAVNRFVIFFLVVASVHTQWENKNSLPHWCVLFFKESRCVCVLLLLFQFSSSQYILLTTIMYISCVFFFTLIDVYTVCECNKCAYHRQTAQYHKNTCNSISISIYFFLLPTDDLWLALFFCWTVNKRVGKKIFIEIYMYDMTNGWSEQNREYKRDERKRKKNILCYWMYVCAIVRQTEKKRVKGMCWCRCVYRVSYGVWVLYINRIVLVLYYI